MQLAYLRRAGGVVGAVLVCVSAASVCAQDAAPDVTTQVHEPEHRPSDYESLITAAVEEFGRANWTEAYALFARAHAIEPNARTLRGMGVCAFEAKQYVRAVEHMREALAATTKALDAAQREEAAMVSERAMAFVAHAAIEPREAVVEVDGQAAVRDEQGRVLLDPGLHQLVIAGSVTQTRVVQVSPGDVLQLSLSPSVREESAVQDVRATEDSVPRSAPHTWAWISAGAAVVFAGVGTSLWLVGSDGVSDVERQCPPGACTIEQIDARIGDESLEELQAGTVVAFALAGASAITSIVLFSTDLEGGGDTQAATIALAPSGLHVRGTF